VEKIAGRRRGWTKEVAREFVTAPPASGESNAIHANGLTGPGVRIPVPFIHLTFIGVALLLRGQQPLPLARPELAMGLGVAIVLSWSVLSFVASWEFLRANTSMLPFRPSRSLITRGPYRFSRNPIYLSLVLIHVGIGLWLSSGWLVASVLPCIPIVERWVIRPEERYLEQRFGARYRLYFERVRRWM
jgi:protein-S-isoprenylcysteine O-methyltransferase Ste14